MKPKIKVTKLDHNPLCIKFLNWRGDRYFIENILDNLKDKFNDTQNKEIVSSRRSNLDDIYLDNLNEFQNRFKKYIQQSIASQNIGEEFLIWLSNAFKYIEEKIIISDKEEIREISIIKSEGRWLEALICYNFIMLYNYFGIAIIKQCPVCKGFFSHKGKYAKYCSDGCKVTGMKK